jgi:hypothetical protein
LNRSASAEVIPKVRAFGDCADKQSSSIFARLVRPRTPLHLELCDEESPLLIFELTQLAELLKRTGKGIPMANDFDPRKALKELEAKGFKVADANDENASVKQIKSNVLRSISDLQDASPQAFNAWLSWTKSF